MIIIKKINIIITYEVCILNIACQFKNKNEILFSKLKRFIKSKKFTLFMPAVNIDKESALIIEKAKNLGINKRTLVSFLIKKYAHLHMNFKEEKIKE